MTESRRGEMERGFSMTLGRIFDPRDTGLLLAVCFGPDDVPAAFCQYVPAPAIEGYSLDLMRRSERPDHPNGLTDFVVVETMNHLREQGLVGLGLNFATMRGVLAGERGDNTTRRVERWFYRKMSDSMQIESLWRYNEKFDPDWVPRFACYDSAEHLLASATALAKAEAWWDIPVVGRFFRPEERGDDADDLPTAEPVAEPAYHRARRRRGRVAARRVTRSRRGPTAQVKSWSQDSSSIGRSTVLRARTSPIAAEGFSE